jgi:hypothetical protein
MADILVTYTQDDTSLRYAILTVSIVGRSLALLYLLAALRHVKRDLESKPQKPTQKNCSINEA